MDAETTAAAVADMVADAIAGKFWQGEADRIFRSASLFFIVWMDIGSELMSYSPLTLSRRHVLGDLYGRCERATNNVPVYLNDTNGERLGFVDESLGKYADAFTFHLSEDVCKRLAGGHYIYSFDFNVSEAGKKDAGERKRKVRLISIFLTMRKGYDKPVPKSARQAEVQAEPADATS